jgi:hypothetical protein
MIRLRYLNPKNETIGTLTLDAENRAIATGAASEDALLTVVEPDTLQRLTPQDGERWLRAVRMLYRTPYCRAVIEDA